jgi:hypothetical protein
MDVEDLNSTIVRVMKEFLRHQASLNSLKKLVISHAGIRENLNLTEKSFRRNLQIFLELSYASKFPPDFIPPLVEAVINNDAEKLVNDEIIHAINLLRPKWMKTMNASEFLKIKLPEPQYSATAKRRKYKSFRSSNKYKYQSPSKVFEWSDFTQSCLHWLSTQELNFDVKVPNWYEDLIVEYADLRELVRSTLFKFCTAFIQPKPHFFGPRSYWEIEGEPDLVMIRNEEIVVPVVIRGSWILNKPNFLNLYQPGEDESVIAAINELYHYMRINFRQYGILTTYEITVFLKREIIDGQDVLYITQDIPYTQKYPTIQESFVYFDSIASHQPFRTPLSLSPQPVDVQGRIDLSCEPFKFDRLLGQGRTKVFLEEYQGEEIALKRADAANDELLGDFENEVQVYKILKDLQGKIIPELKFAGRIGSDFNCLGFSLCGSVPDEFEWTEERKEELRKIFQEIHSRKVTHNDIKIENILVKDGNLFVIDFGFGKIDSFKWQITDEKQNIDAFLRSL